jgi:enoyl-CoA hydratase
LTTISYKVDNRVAHITLNRPEVLNSINDTMPGELSACVDKANDDSSVHVIVLSGAGKAFSAGYDLSYYAQSGSKDAVQDMPWDSTPNTSCLSSVHRSLRCVKYTVMRWPAEVT